MEKARVGYMNHEVQNELIKLYNGNPNPKEDWKWPSVMIDACTDMQNQEQVRTQSSTTFLTTIYISVNSCYLEMGGQ